jgi:hypothetical protein
MLTELDGYRNGVMDAKVQSKVLELSPSLGARYVQLGYFRRYKGSRCGYFKGAVELLLRDMKALGYRFRDGIILTPAGDKLWPMI